MVGRKKYVFGYFVLESDTNHKEMFQKRIDPLYIGPDKSFYKGNHTIADLRYGGKYITSPSTLVFASIKG